MSEKAIIKDKMKNGIIKNGENCNISIYEWYAKLDYTKSTSHPEYAVLNEKVEDDFRKIEDAIYLIRLYLKLDKSIINNLMELIFRYSEIEEYIKNKERANKAKLAKIEKTIKDTFDEKSIKHFPDGLSVDLPFSSLNKE